MGLLLFRCFASKQLLPWHTIQHTLTQHTQVLVRRSGHPAALAIILHDVLQRLLLSGDLPCAALVTGGAWGGLPSATPLPNVTRAMAVNPSSPGSALNTCSSEVGRACGMLACFSQLLTTCILYSFSSPVQN